MLKPDFFVVAGMQGGVKKFYVRGQIKGEEVRGVTILYDKALETTIDRIVVAVLERLRADSRRRDGRRGPPGAAAAGRIRDRHRREQGRAYRHRPHGRR